MNTGRIIPAMAIAASAMLAAGCAGRTAERETARRLSANLQIYEIHLDSFLKRQQALQSARLAEIQQSRRELLEDEVNGFRISAVTEAAREMVAAPVEQTSASRVTALLKRVHEQEDRLTDKLQAAQRETIRQTQRNIADLQKRKLQVEQVRKALVRLSNGSGLADDADDLRSYIEEAGAPAMKP